MSSNVPFSSSRSAPVPPRRQVAIPPVQPSSPAPLASAPFADAPAPGLAPPTPRRPAPKVANPTPRSSTGSAGPPDYSIRNSYAEPDEEEDEEENVRRAIEASLAEHAPAPRQGASASRQTWDDNASLHSAQSRKAGGKKSIFSRN